MFMSCDFGMRENQGPSNSEAVVFSDYSLIWPVPGVYSESKSKVLSDVVCLDMHLSSIPGNMSALEPQQCSVPFCHGLVQ